MEKFFLFAFFMKQENSMYRLSGSGFRVSPWGVLPLDCVRKRFSGFCRFYGFSGEGATHKNMEAPRSINTAMPEDGISVTSH